MSGTITITEKYVRKYDEQSGGRSVLVRSGIGGITSLPANLLYSVEDSQPDIPIEWNEVDSIWDLSATLRLTGDLIAGSAQSVSGFKYIGAEIGAGSAVDLYNLDLDDIDSSCVLYTTSGTNRPGGFPGFVRTFVYDTDEASQVFQRQDDDEVYIRRKTSGVWQAWEDISSGVASESDPVFTAWRDGRTSERILGRVSSGTGEIEELTSTQVRSLINVADGANNYSHPNHSGDVTSVGDGATTIASKAVTFAKFQDIATGRILGRTTSGSGAVEELNDATVRALLNVADGANNYTHPNHSGDVTSVGDGVTSIANNVVGNDKIRVSSGYSVIGKATTGTGNVADIIAGSNGVLRRSGTGDLAFGTIVTGNIGNKQVTWGKLEDAAADSILGRASTSGSVSPLNAATVRSITGTLEEGTGSGQIRSNSDLDARYGRLASANTWTAANQWKQTGNSYLITGFSTGNGMFLSGFDNQATPERAFILRTYPGTVNNVQMLLEAGGLQTVGDVIAGSGVAVTGNKYIGGETGAGSAVDLYNGDLNDIDVSCELYTSTGTNRPVAAIGFVKTIIYDENIGVQIYMRAGADEIYYRRKSAGTSGVWQSWQQLTIT